MNNKLFRTILISATFIVVVLCIISITRDDSKTNDSDLRITMKVVSTKENGYPIILLAGEKVRISKEAETIKKILKQQPFNEVQAISILNIYSKELQVFFDGLSYPNFERCVNRSKINIAPLGLIELAQIQAKLDLYNGQVKKAAEIGVYMIKLGDRFENCHGLIFDYFIGMNLKRNGAKVIREVLGSGLSHYDARLIRQRIAPYQNNKKGLIEAFQFDYTTWSPHLDNLQEFCEKWDADPRNEDIQLTSIRKLAMFLPFLYKPNKTRRLYAEKYRVMINDIATGKRMGTSVQFWKPSYFSNNMIGEILMTVVPLSPSLVDQQQEVEKELHDLLKNLG